MKTQIYFGCCLLFINLKTNGTYNICRVFFVYIRHCEEDWWSRREGKSGFDILHPTTALPVKMELVELTQNYALISGCKLKTSNAVTRKFYPKRQGLQDTHRWFHRMLIVWSHLWKYQFVDSKPRYRIFTCEPLPLPVPNAIPVTNHKEMKKKIL